MTIKLVEVSAVSVKAGASFILQDISFTINKGEQWAIVGGSGSGKTTLAKVLTGKLFFSGELTYHFSNQLIALVEQQHHFKNRSNTSSFYYQQRFNAADAEDSITVKEALADEPLSKQWIELLQLSHLLEKPLIQLSNGENKRLQLVKALQQMPALLILDNPFTGLDTEGRKILHTVIDNMVSAGIHIILITSAAELPGSITHVAVLEKGKLLLAAGKYEYHPKPLNSPAVLNIEQLHQSEQPVQDDFELAVKMENVNIQYGEKRILSHINWEVKKGECWSVSGPNGAGKSTLLSLITADNPQAYANKIILFDKKRGSGESIWDIKRKIGFVSPELHLYFEQTASCFEVIGSGLFDTIGLFRHLSAEQEQKIVWWMRLLKLGDLRNKRIYELSTSQQRMTLLARALVKNPPLLILDEP